MSSIVNKVLIRIERLFSRKWYNPIASLYLNLRCLPIKQAIKLPISVYGRPSFLELGGKIIINGEVKHGMVKYNSSHIAAPSFQGCQSELAIRGKLIINGFGQIDTGTKIFINTGAELILGKGFKICDFVNIGCYGKIVIGDMSWIVHRCQLFDTNYHFIVDLKTNSIPSTIKPIYIGKYCWICNSSTITGGVHIEDYTVIGSNSVVNKSIKCPQFSLIAGIPAKLIKTGIRKVEHEGFTRSLYKHYNNTSNVYTIMDNQYNQIFVYERDRY